MQDLALNQHFSEKECSYKSYRRFSDGLAVYNYHSPPIPMELVTRHENENESETETESKNSLPVSVIGLFLLAISFAYAIIVSMIFKTLFGWKSNPFCNVLRERAPSKTAFPKTPSSSKHRKSASQG